jgi:hypothetical protein
MSAIKVGDTFTHPSFPGAVFVAKRVSNGDIVSQADDTFHASNCTKVHVTIRPAKTARKWKASELRAWHRSRDGWNVGNSGALGYPVYARVRVGDVVVDTRAENEAKAILALRKQLRAKGVKL